MSITRESLQKELDLLLKPSEVKDYCPNGLQVEGKSEIRHLVTGVTASQALIDAAIEQQADAILVHHGYFWKGESGVITGMKRKRIAALLAHDINLFAYHLPIDIHPRFGNNAQLGALLGLEHVKTLADVKPQGIVYSGELPTPISQAQLKERISNVLNRSPLVEGDRSRSIRTVAWCSGGGQGFIEQAAAAGMDAFISGEVSEQTIHIAREMDIHFFAAGHHATERYGVKAVGEYIAEKLKIDVRFIDIDNPA
ncbi:Nif3-like dinuclear metal center hexameric protein [Alteromonas pelagimontana]|uniref:GTP cyclohydrolase 1 type 2 homolog n=1 Tax=Alteromonas pelagimontana TaxID=1858656 RepID=A0A6M4MHG1_9ALTE|nr:Nif3-like dinuclear metal center hexameric protein [Alteromonas pelagimontana]QJR82549.1 Nif3-like dinuclear metal center hexameric protein [Alteromonas pelagimontana]